MSTKQLDPCTPDSIARARAAMLSKRAELMRVAGVGFTADGRVILPRPKAKRPKRWYCAFCLDWFMSRLDCPRCGCFLLRAH